MARKSSDDPLMASSSSFEQEDASSNEQEKKQSEPDNSSLKLQPITLENKQSPKKQPPSTSLQPHHSSSVSGSGSDSESESKGKGNDSKKRPPSAPIQPHHSSFASGSESDSESESEDGGNDSKKRPPSAPLQPHHSSSVSASESDSESESKGEGNDSKKRPPSASFQPRHSSPVSRSKSVSESKSEGEGNDSKKRPPSTSLQSHHSPSVSGTESDSESVSGSGSEAIANPKAKLNASKSMEECKKGKNASSQPSEYQSRSAMKRSIANNSEGEGNDMKRAKKGTDSHADDKVSVEDDGKTKKLFQRVWNEEDEIAILEGAVEYRKKTGTDPSKNMRAFHDFIKNSLHVDATKNQLVDKFRRLKKKYKNNEKRGKNGQDPTFSKFHDRKVYEVSKKIWADEKSGGESIMPSLKIERIDTPSSNQNLDSMMLFKDLDENYLKSNLKYIEEPKKTELVEKWKEMQISQLKLCVKRAKLLKYHAKTLLETFK